MAGGKPPKTGFEVITCSRLAAKGIQKQAITTVKTSEGTRQSHIHSLSSVITFIVSKAVFVLFCFVLFCFVFFFC
jgi:hypothetical protein